VFLLIGCVVAWRRKRVHFIDFQRRVAAPGERFRVRRCAQGSNALARLALLVTGRKRRSANNLPRGAREMRQSFAHSNAKNHKSPRKSPPARASAQTTSADSTARFLKIAA
jgi:hypothetical protein